MALRTNHSILFYRSWTEGVFYHSWTKGVRFKATNNSMGETRRI